MRFLILVMLLSSCARMPLAGPENAFRETSAPKISDDLPLEPLFHAIETQVKFLEGNPGATPSVWVFGERRVPREEYLAGLKRFVELGKGAPNPEEFYARVAEEFEFLEVYGQPGWGDVFMTSYFEPRIPGSPVRTARFSQPLYQAPPEMVEVDLALFDSKYTGERKFRGRIEGKAIVPYYTREEIDSKHALKGRRLELCWVDPVDAFFLQIQGSGTVDLGRRGGLVRINYADKNGQAYEPVGKFLRDLIPPEELNLHGIEAYLRTLPREALQGYLNKNPSYVFFQKLDRSAVTYLGVPATDGRTIATDRRYFPKGALGFIEFSRPRFDPPDSLKVAVEGDPVGRFVLDQDIGGAITGGGRVDLFWGRGAEAKKYAGVMKAPGTLRYLVPRRR
jgi:membrane-bound lytic murein transglycosylase A